MVLTIIRLTELEISADHCRGDTDQKKTSCHWLPFYHFEISVSPATPMSYNVALPMVLLLIDSKRLMLPGTQELVNLARSDNTMQKTGN
jgi:hypothetical protein